MRNHVLGVAMDIVTHIELATLIVSVIALFISYVSLKESEKARIESGRAFLSMELIQVSEKLYVILRNIGNTYAYDVEVIATADFVNCFESLSTIQPGSTYGFLLLNSQSVSHYPETITFKIKYHDCYAPKHFIQKEFTFNIIDYIKYDVTYNKEFDYYDIKKSF